MVEAEYVPPFDFILDRFYGALCQIQGSDQLALPLHLFSANNTYDLKNLLWAISEHLPTQRFCLSTRTTAQFALARLIHGKPLLSTAQLEAFASVSGLELGQYLGNGEYMVCHLSTVPCLRGGCKIVVKPPAIRFGILFLIHAIEEYSRVTPL